MKKIALAFCGAAFLLAGCAREQASFSGHAFTPLPPGQSGLPATEATGEHRGAIHNFGIIRAIRGWAEVSGDGTKWKKALVGTKVGAGSVVRTPKDSIVDIFLGENGPVIRLMPESAIRFERLDLENTGIEKIVDTEIELQRGWVLGSVKKMAAASKYVVRTPTSVVQIRGTEFSISDNGSVKIISGTVEVLQDGQKFTVVGGQKFEPGNGVHALTQSEIGSNTMEVTFIHTGIYFAPTPTNRPNENSKPPRTQSRELVPSRRFE